MFCDNDDDNDDYNDSMCCQDIFSELDLDGDEDALRELKQTQLLHSKQAAGICSPAGCVYVQPAPELSALGGGGGLISVIILKMREI